MKKKCKHPHFYLLQSILSDKETIYYCNCLECGQNMLINESTIKPEQILIPNIHNFENKVILIPTIGTVVEKYQTRFAFYYETNPTTALEKIKILAQYEEQNKIYERMYNQEAKDLEAATKTLKKLRKKL